MIRDSDWLPASPELRLILAIARRFVGCDEDQSIGELCQKPLDWEFLLAAANWHKFSGLLTRTPEFASGPMALQCNQMARAQALKALSLTATLLRLKEQLDLAAIPFLQIKGLSVAQMAYGDLALRPSLDLDIILRPEDMPRAMEIFHQMGFHPYQQESALLQRFRTRVDCQTGLTDGRTSLDVHWSFGLFPEMFPLSAVRAIDRASDIQIGGRSIPVPQMDDLLCFLCFHGAKHLWTRLFWVLDIALMSRKGLFGPQLPEDRILELNQQFPVCQAFLLAEQLFDTPLPPLIARWRDQFPELQEKTQRVLQLLFSQQQPAADSYGIGVSLGRKMLWESGLYADWRTRAAVLGRYLFQPASADLQSLALPAGLFPLYYLWRPGRLVFRELFRKVLD